MRVQSSASPAKKTPTKSLSKQSPSEKLRIAKRTKIREQKKLKRNQKLQRIKELKRQKNSL